MHVVLRKYQQDVVDRIVSSIREGARSILLVAPTGSGKTRMVSAACKVLNLATIGLAHRVEICSQIRKEFNITGPDRHLVCGPTSGKIAPALTSGQFAALFVDEAHHSSAISYRRIIDNRGAMTLIGATATPYRSDGASLRDIYDVVIQAPSERELTRHGYLAKVTYVSSENADFEGIKLNKKKEFEEKDALRRVRVAVQVGDIALAWRKYAKGKNALIYAINIEHCESIYHELRAQNISCEIISARSTRHERRTKLDAFEHGRTRALINCEVFTEGTDVRNVGVVIMVRPTNSRALYKQMIGRGMRPDVACTVLDLVGNFKRHGNVLVEDPIDVLDAAKISTASASSSENISMDVDYRRVELHIERVNDPLKKIWTPSIFKV